MTNLERFGYQELNYTSNLKNPQFLKVTIIVLE
jgi:hypothetical protein